MRRTALLFLVLALALALTAVSVTAAGAKAPGTSDRSGELVLELNFGAFADPPIAYSEVTWIGTVEFDHGVYGIAYFLSPGNASDVVSHWTEAWEIYEFDPGQPFYEFSGPVLTMFDPGEPLLVAHDAGITHWKNFTWIGNGRVDSAASAFAEWEGRNTHTSGGFTLSFDPPMGSAEGILRFN